MEADEVRLISLTVGLILRYFQFKRVNGSLSPRPGSGIKADCPGKLNQWQRKYFFCRLDGVLDVKWRTEGICDAKADSEADPKNLLSELGLVETIYSEAELAGAGLSPYRADVHVDPVKFAGKIGSGRIHHFITKKKKSQLNVTVI